MPVETLGDIKFHTQVIGSGPPLVCAHGLLFGNLAGWMFGAGGALASQYAVHLFDLRGHGRSSRPVSGYDLDTMTQDLRGLLERWSLSGEQPVTLAGHSYGALMSLRIALERPLHRLVLVEPPLPPTPIFDLEAFLDRDREALIEVLPRPIQLAVAQGGRRVRRLIDGLFHLLTETTLAEDIAKPHYWPEDELKVLRTPTLIILGTDSPCLEGGLRLAEVMPNAEVLQLEGGHFLTAERPAELTAAMEGFLG